MIIIQESQEEKLREECRRGFIRALTDECSERYARAIGSRPFRARRAIIENCLGRASLYGVTWQSSLAVFAGMMLNVAPNFDRYPRIAELLQMCRPQTDDANRMICSLTTILERRIWDRIIRERDTLPLYTPAQHLNSPLQIQIATALPLVFAGWGQLHDTKDLAVSGARHARILGMDSRNDGRLLCAAAQVIYGEKFSCPAEVSGMEEVLREDNSPKEKCDALRRRIALDTGVEI